MHGNSGELAAKDSIAEETSDFAPKALGWQATKPNVKKRISHMFCNEMLADVYFIIRSDKSRERIPAHKFMLSVSSAVFDAMFNGGLSHYANNSNEMEVVDVEKPAFLNLLRFIYRDDENMDPEDVIPTLYAAKKYGVYGLERVCVDQLEKSLCAENALELLAQSRHFDEENLERKCLIIIDTQAKDVFASDSFTSLHRSTIKEILEKDTLGVREICIFEAMCRWAEAECIRNGLHSPSKDQMRAAIGDLIYLIRFPLMTPAEFADGPKKSGMLLSHYCTLLSIYLNAMSPYSLKSFSTNRRGCEMSVARFSETTSLPSYMLDVPESVTFSTNQVISVTGLGLYGCNGRYTFPVTIQILRKCGDVLVSEDTSFYCDGSDQSFKASFAHPVRIAAETEHTARVHIKGYSTYRGLNAKETVISGATTFRFSEEYSQNGTNQQNYGQIPVIYFQLSI